MAERLAVVRADASVAMGHGHVVRCLTLADAIRAQAPDIRIVFVCRAHAGHLRDLIGRRGYACRMLPEPPESPVAGDEHERWLGVSAERDLRETVEVLAGLGGPDLVVVDHYALDADWEAEIAAQGAAVAVVDDLADRPHAADLLLDQSLGHPADAYAGLVPARCRCLLGPAYALLRPAFAARREDALARRARSDAVARVLVAPGGTDTGDLAGRALEAAATHAPDVNVDVVLGSAAPRLDVLRSAAAEAPDRIRLHVDTDEMPALMAAADIAVGSCGMTAWERCSLGLPALAVVDGANQAGNAEGLAAAGAARVLGPVADVGVTDLGEALADLCADASRRRRMGDAAARLCDGAGAARVAAAVTEYLA